MIGTRLKRGAHMCWRRWVASWLLAGVVVSGCGVNQPEPARRVEIGDLLDRFGFASDAEGWGTYIAPDAAAVFEHLPDERALSGTILVERGHAVMLGPRSAGDVVVQAKLKQTDRLENTTSSFGLMCRADDAGNGYYFLISSTGRASIQKALPDVMDLIPLADWQPVPMLTDVTSENEVVATCAGDYLSLYVNGQFVADAFDPDFEDGRIGVALAGGLVERSPASELNKTVQIQIDNVAVYAVQRYGVR